MIRVDEVDGQIINLLMEDGRMSSTEISRRIGRMTERAVRYRINRLVAGGLIQVSAIAKPKAFGYSVIADVFLEVETDLIPKVAKQMAGYDCVSYVAYSIGETDVSVQIVARDTGEVYRFITEVIAKTPGVRKTTTHIVPQVVKDVYQWHVPASIYQKEKP
jgi:Lrp/AsnC family transcriptional regulator for asnA, asnC and gidA